MEYIYIYAQNVTDIYSDYKKHHGGQMLKKISFCIMILSSFAYSQTSKTDSIGIHTVIITSEPSEASVFIDDSSYGKTPLRLMEFPMKPFLLRLIDNEQNKWGLFIGDIKSKEVTVHALIAKNYGQLAAFTEPSGADLFINDSLAGKTPTGPINIPTGLTKVKLKKENYITYEEVVNIPKKIAFLYQIDVKLRSIYTALDLQALSSYSNVLLDGNNINMHDLKTRKLLAGEHNIRINRSGSEPDLNLDFNAANDTVYSVFVRPKQFNYKPVLFSLLVPGSGQLFEGSTVKGAGILTGFIALGAAVYFTSDNYSKKINLYDQQRLTYLASKNELEALANKEIMLAAKDDMDKALRPKQLTIGLLLGTYLYNVLDVMLFHSFTDMLDIKKTRSGIDLPGSADFNTGGVTFGMKYNL